MIGPGGMVPWSSSSPGGSMPMTSTFTSRTVSRRSWSTVSGNSPTARCYILPSGPCSSGRSKPTTFCCVSRRRLVYLLSWCSRIVIEGKLGIARVSAAALHLCDVELIGPLRPQSSAQAARLPARRHRSPDGRYEHYG